MPRRTKRAAELRREYRRLLDTITSPLTKVLVTSRGEPIDEPPAVRFGALRGVTTIVDASDELLSAGDGSRSVNDGRAR